jgi:hypothetical protein
MTTINMHNIIYNNKKYVIMIEKDPYILDKTIQPVYKYYSSVEEDDHYFSEILTYYTNGCDKTLFPVYHDLINYPKHILDILLKNLLPE